MPCMQPSERNIFERFFVLSLSVEPFFLFSSVLCFAFVFVCLVVSRAFCFPSSSEKVCGWLKIFDVLILNGKFPIFLVDNYS